MCNPHAAPQESSNIFYSLERVDKYNNQNLENSFFSTSLPPTFHTFQPPALAELRKALPSMQQPLSPPGGEARGCICGKRIRFYSSALQPSLPAITPRKGGLRFSLMVPPLKRIHIGNCFRTLSVPHITGLKPRPTVWSGSVCCLIVLPSPVDIIRGEGAGGNWLCLCLASLS